MSGDTQKIRFERAHGYKRSYRDSSSYQVTVQKWHLIQSHREDKMTIVRLQDLHLLHAILEDAARDLRFVHQELHSGIGALQQVVDRAGHDRTSLVEHQDMRSHPLNLMQQV